MFEKIFLMTGEKANLTATDKRIPEYDGIRGVAIILILTWHCINNLVVYKQDPFCRFLLLITGRSWSGVDLFFVLSGFLLGAVLLKNWGSKNYFTTFYYRRICRIFPLYYFFFIIYYILYHTSLAQAMPWVFKDTLPFWSYASFTQNFLMAKYNILSSHGFGHTYSLAIEEQFYLFLPVILFFLRGKKLLVFIAVGTVAALYFRLTASNWIAAFALPLCRADDLLMGVLTAYLTINSRTNELLARHKEWLYILLYAMLVLFAAHGIGMITINYYFASSLQAVLFALFILLVCVDKQSRLVIFLQSKILQRFGKFSFGIYIYHNLVLGIFHYTILGHAPAISSITSLLVTLLAIAVTYLVAVLSYYSFEKRIIGLGHRYVY